MMRAVFDKSVMVVAAVEACSCLILTGHYFRTGGECHRFSGANKPNHGILKLDLVSQCDPGLTFVPHSIFCS